MDNKNFIEKLLKKEAKSAGGKIMLGVLEKILEQGDNYSYHKTTRTVKIKTKVKEIEEDEKIDEICPF